MQDYYEVAEYLEDSLMVIDNLGSIFYANPATSILYGQPIELIKGKKLSEAYPGGLGGRMFRAVQAAVDNGRLVVRNLTAGLPNFPKLVDIRIYPSSLKPKLHKKGAILLSYEVTEREALKEQTATIRRAAALEQLTRRMAHELRNPLNSLGLNLELLEDEFDNLPEESREETFEITSLLKKQVKRLTEIVESYRELGKMPPLNLVETNGKKIVTDLAHFFKGEASSKGIVIKVECNENVPNLLVDANYIREAILNLMRNAIEAMPTGGNLTIRLTAENGQVFIQVKDTGIGIKKERQKIIFDLAYTTKPNGSGVGLPLVKQIVQQHGGSVHLESKLQKGTTFTLQLPCSQNSEAEVEHPEKRLLSEVEKFVFGVN
ncbi:PAS domain-containing protein [bacterium]|nr:PAS domain-containing protein [bacterium]